MSEKQRFAVRESVEIWDERKGSLWATAVNADRAQLIADALNAAYVRQAEPQPQERVDTSQDYYVWTYANLRDGKPMHAVKHRAKDGDVMTVAVYERCDEARQECVRLNALRNDVRQQAEAKAAPQRTAADPVDAPDHYRQGEIECIDAVKAMLGAEGFAYWLRGNMVAYVWRMPHKGEAKKDAGKTRNLAERLERLLGG